MGQQIIIKIDRFGFTTILMKRKTKVNYYKVEGLFCSQQTYFYIILVMLEPE